MNKKTLAILAVLLAIPLAVGTALAQTGNGAPSGTHYNLNLVGKANCSGDDLTGSNRHTIQVLLNFWDEPDPDAYLGNDPGNFLSLDKRNKIFLYSGTDFLVTDGNACDNNGASFYLPANVATAWEVYVRELGKPGGYGDLRTCGISAGEDGIEGNADDEIVCSTENVILTRYSGKTSPDGTGKSTFRNVTKELTTLVYYPPILDAEGNIIGWGNPIRVQLFDDDFYQYFWDFDNHGLRLVQLRFYPIGS